jgi:hypothetical protein
MNESTKSLRAHHSENPEDEQNDKNRPKHRSAHFLQLQPRPRAGCLESDRGAIQNSGFNDFSSWTLI